MAAGPDAVRDETVEVWDSRLRLHVKVAGDGPPLLFFHPLAGLAWQPLLGRLAQRHTVYAPEHPGTSPGDPQAIREVQTYWELLLIYTELAGQLGLERPVAIGQSFGGMVAADLAASFPRLFSALVLLSPLGLWRGDAPIPLMEMVSGPPSDVPKYLYAHPGSDAAQAAQALPGARRLRARGPGRPARTLLDRDHPVPGRREVAALSGRTGGLSAFASRLTRASRSTRAPPPGGGPAPQNRNDVTLRRL